MTISDADLEHRLRDLRLRAEEIAPAPFDLAERIRERHRVERRRRIALTATGIAAGIAAALVVVGIPTVASGVLGDRRGNEAAGPTQRTSHELPRSRGLYDLPTRGSLAGEDAWLTDVAALAWDGFDPALAAPGSTVPAPAVDTRHVAFAGDVPSGRVALVLGLEGRTTVYAWFTGPYGAEARDMELATMPREAAAQDELLALMDALEPDPPMDAAEADPPVATLVVVGLPGDSGDRALPPVVEASGEIRSLRADLPMWNGIAMTTVPAGWPLTAGDLRIHRPHGAAAHLLLQDSFRMPDEPLSRVTPEDPRGLAAATGVPMLEELTGQWLQTYALTAAEAHPTVLAAGPLVARGGRSGVLMGMTFPSGATGTWVATWVSGNPDAGVTGYDIRIEPAGTPLLDQVIAVRAMAGVMVSSPSGVAAQVLDAEGTVLDTLPLVDGAGSGPLSEAGAARTVRLLDARGAVVAEVPLEVIGR
jgi:hypothetical protein